jgi:serine protease Do
MNFVVASNTLKKYLPDLKNGAIISKGLWGVNLRELEPYDIKTVGLEKNSGMLVCDVLKYSPAEKAGIKRGDIILSVNGKDLKDNMALRKVSNDVYAGSISDIVVNRYGEIKKFKVKADNVRYIEKLEKGEIGEQEWSNENITYRLLTSKMHRKLRFPKDVSGIIVSEIKNNSNPMLTLAVGDVIMQVNDEKIESIEDYKKVIKKLKKNKKTMAMFHIYKPIYDAIFIKGSNIAD